MFDEFEPRFLRSALLRPELDVLLPIFLDDHLSRAGVGLMIKIRNLAAIFPRKPIGVRLPYTAKTIRYEMNLTKLRDQRHYLLTI